MKRILIIWAVWEITAWIIEKILNIAINSYRVKNQIQTGSSSKILLPTPGTVLLRVFSLLNADTKQSFETNNQDIFNFWKIARNKIDNPS